MSVIVLGMMTLYLVIASVAVLVVWRRTSRKLYRWLAVAVAVLLPSWDVLLSTAFFYAACPFLSKTAIYETAETDGIYYEGDHYNKIIMVNVLNGERARVPLAGLSIDKGYKYSEYLITKRKEGAYGTESSVSPPVVYQCNALARDPQWPWNIPYECIPIKETKSNYAVKSKSIEILLVAINSVDIYDNANKRVMAEYREIFKRPHAGGIFPFFTWLNWDYGEFRGGTDPISCPRESQFLTFQYRVLTLKK